MRFSKLSSDEHQARVEDWRERRWDVLITMSLIVFGASGLTVLMLGDIGLAIMICAIAGVPSLIFALTAELMIYLHLRSAVPCNQHPSPVN
jgi:hypothetical protein